MSYSNTPVQNDANDDSGTSQKISDVESPPYYGVEVPVTFFPSLNDTRRAWLLKKLRQERVNSVLDVGCGEGTLLSCLCNSPVFLKPEKEGGENEILYRANTSGDGFPDLQVSRIAGLDISSRALEKCIRATSPHPLDYQLNIPRWHKLKAKIWQGSLDIYNPEFQDIDCIVSSEVIEHLPPSVLHAFASTLLGLYRPRIVLITTPNYAFNARFTKPGTVDPVGFLDPTGRTNRVFRHSDHKFEWTPSEFKAWCQEAAATCGYSVEVDAVGQAMEPDPWGRDEELGSASQVALFRRNDDWQGQSPVPPSQTQEGAHRLLKTHIHPPHPRAGMPDSHEKICEIVTKYMESYYFDDGYSVWDLWVENTIPIACGGRLDVLLSAIDASPALRLTRKDGAAAREWNVKFAGDKHREAVEASKKQYWERRFPHDTAHYQSNGLEAENTPDETPKWPDPAQDWYSLAKAIPTDDESWMTSGADGWGESDRWSVGWNEVKTTNVCA